MSPRAKTDPDPKLMTQVARSVDAPDPLIPVLARLFDGLDGLGCMPALTSRLLMEAGVGARTRVVDVGCGKGAVGVALVRLTGCRVVGIDACAAFVDAARDLADRRGVAERCEFILGDLHHVARAIRTTRKRRTGRAARSGRARGTVSTFDAALMMGVRPLGQAVEILRPLVRPNGLYAIDDVIAAPGKRLPAGVDVLTRAEARAVLERHGDVVLREHIPTPSRIAALNRSLYRRIASNARAIAAEQPRLRSALTEFLRRQREANKQLIGPVRPLIWVVRRGPGW